MLLIVASLALLAFLAWGPAQSLRQLRDAPRSARATAASLAALMTLGYVFKDSGIAVPAMMLGVTVAVLAFVVPDAVASHDPPSNESAADLDASATMVSP